MAALASIIVGSCVAVAGAAVAGGVAGGMEASGKASALAVVESRRLQSKSEVETETLRSNVEGNRILSEAKQAKDWLNFDIAESQADRQEAIAFQKKLDQSMGIYNDERNIQKAGTQTATFDHQYPSLDSNQQASA